MVSVEQTLFGQMPLTKENVQMYTLRNALGFQVNLISYGAAIQSVLVPDRDKQLVNVALGFDSFQGDYHLVFYLTQIMYLFFLEI